MTKAAETTQEMIPTAALCDVASTPIAMNRRIGAIWRGARVHGPAFTIREAPGTQSALRIAVEQAPPGSVLVIDAGAFDERALWGEALSLRAMERGISGVVVDGAVRDVACIEALRFPVFAIAVTPRPPMRATGGELQADVQCGDLLVSPGDMIYGDLDGVVTIPLEQHVELATKARRLIHAERDSDRNLKPLPETAR